MTLKEWENLKSGDVITLKDYCNYWIVYSIGYEDLPKDEWSDDDYIIEVSEYDNGNIGGTIIKYYQVEEIITDPLLLEALKYGKEHSDDYLSFVEGFNWAKNIFNMNNYFTELKATYKYPEDTEAHEVTVKYPKFDCTIEDLIQMFHSLCIGMTFHDSTFKNGLSEYLEEKYNMIVTKRDG